jgi:alanyl-tRNA synthetase
VQKCVRTGDIDEVGNETHHTFFEMLGNWSLGDYWKEEAIKMSYEFLTGVLGLEKEKMAVTCFAGDEDSPRDEESAKVWLELGIKPERMAFMGKHDNWWPTPRKDQVGPCGPDTEMFYWASEQDVPEKFDPTDKRWVEIWNDVFMEYNKTPRGYEKLKQKNVDTGMGVERTLAVLNGLDDNYLTSVFEPVIQKIENISGKNYDGNENVMRVIADHVRAAVFILGDERGVKPGNVGQGYVLRRLIRRAVRFGRLLGIEKENFLSDVAKSVLPLYPDYQELHRNHKFILENLDEEEQRFGKTLEKGLKKFEEVINDGVITGKEAFLLFQSYGFPIEMTQELALEKGVKVDLEEYNQEFAKHQDLSRSMSAGTFKSGLADDSEVTRKLHTATHLLNEALRRVLGDEVKQKGSNITPARLRFDFNFSRKLTPEEIGKIEGLVNEKISAGLEVEREEVPLSDALDSGAQAEFGAKYPDLVSVYTILDKSEDCGFFSKEICTGPHVRNTSELGKFKIVKEESSSAGVRRIKAILD